MDHTTRVLLLLLGFAAFACSGQSESRPDSTTLAQTLAEEIVSIQRTNAPDRPTRVFVGPSAFDTLVAAELISRGGRFIAMDDSVYVDRVATGGAYFRGDTALIPVVWATCVKAETAGFTWYGTAVQYRFLRERPTLATGRGRWRKMEEGQEAFLDGDCTNGNWPPRWWVGIGALAN